MRKFWDPKVLRLFLLDRAKAVSKAVRAAFGRHTPIQCCQVHKARKIAEHCPKKHVASVRRTLRKAWELDDDAEAERLIRDLAMRMQREAPGVSGSILQGLDEVLAGSASRRSCAARSIAPTPSRTCRARSGG
jgi:putative transposase